MGLLPQWRLMASLCSPGPTKQKRSSEMSMIIPNENSHAIWRRSRIPVETQDGRRQWIYLVMVREKFIGFRPSIKKRQKYNSRKQTWKSGFWWSQRCCERIKLNLCYPIRHSTAHCASPRSLGLWGSEGLSPPQHPQPPNLSVPKFNDLSPS